MYSWFYRLQILEDEDDFQYENYEKNSSTALELIKEEAITNEDVKKSYCQILIVMTYIIPFLSIHNFL